MSFPIVYPASLPPPATLQTVSAERRFVSQSPFTARAFQRDRLVAEDAAWPPMTAAEIAVFRDWFDNTLIGGGRWFLSSWPLPQGMIAGTRRFLAPPTLTYLAGGFWTASAKFEVQGAGQPPVIDVKPILGMHMLGDFSDSSGHPLSLYAQGSTGYAPPTIIPGLFNEGAYHGDAGAGFVAESLCSDVRGSLNINQYGEYQISGFVRPHYFAGYGQVGGQLLKMHAAVLGGDDAVWPGPTYAANSPSAAQGPGDVLQFLLSFIQLGTSTTQCTPQFTRPFLAPEDGVTYQVDRLYDLGGTPFAVNNDVWSFFAVCEDATSTRLYINTQLVQDDSLPGSGGVTSPINRPGARPLYYNPARPFTNQTFDIASAYVGTYDDPRTWTPPMPARWPRGAAWGTGWQGDFCQLNVKMGIGAVDFHGSTIVVPTSRFRG